MKIGLVLSGGGARGIMHLGVIKALNEHGLAPHFIAGTSAGAIAGALVSHGYSPDEVLQIILKTNFFKYLRPTFSAPGLLKMDRVEELYLQLLPHNSFSQLKTPLIVAATDMEQGEIVYFDKGELIRPLMASSCLPGIFAPVHYQKRTLVDGAVLNNLPIEPLLERHVNFLIASNCNPHSLDKPIRSTRSIIERSLLLAVSNKTQERLQRCDIVLEPKEVGQYDIFDVRKAREIFQIGYRSAHRNPTLLGLLAEHQRS